MEGTNYLAFTDADFGYVYHRRRAAALQRPGQPRAAPAAPTASTRSASPGPGGTTVTGDGSGQTIAIVEEGVDPTLGADLTTFDQFFGIPAPPSFQVVDQNGVTTQNLDIVGEASLDVEWAHAIAPGASIVVYNAAYEPNNPTASSRKPDHGDAASLEAAGGLGRHPELWQARVVPGRVGAERAVVRLRLHHPGRHLPRRLGRFRDLRQRQSPGRRELSGRLAQRRLPSAVPRS